MEEAINSIRWTNCKGKEEIILRRQTGGTNMKLLVNVIISIILVAISCNAQLNYREIPPPPGRYEIQHLSILAPASSLDQLIRNSNLIIDGTVDKVLPSIRLDSGDPKSLETYSRIFVNKVIRGKLPEGQQFVALAEPGGNSEGYEIVFTEHPLVKSGERYILFLNPYPARKGFMNAPPGTTLYLAVGSWAGKAKVTKEEVVQFLPAASNALHFFDNLNVGAFVTSLKERINYLYPPPPPYTANPGPPPPGMHFPLGRP
jgi:hypothetical protein